jgi:hypothetical protein
MFVWMCGWMGGWVGGLVGGMMFGMGRGGGGKAQHGVCCLLLPDTAAIDPPTSRYVRSSSSHSKHTKTMKRLQAFLAKEAALQVEQAQEYAKAVQVGDSID